MKFWHRAEPGNKTPIPRSTPTSRGWQTKHYYQNDEGLFRQMHM